MNTKRIDEYAYWVSDTGDIINRDGLKMKQHIGRSGYLCISLSKKCKQSYHSVHRLVAECWCPNPHHHEYVNHLDGDKLNNKASNLEWCTSKENARHAIDNGLVNNLIHVSVKDTETGEKTTHNSIREASKHYGIPHPTLQCNLRTAGFYRITNLLFRIAGYSK